MNSNQATVIGAGGIGLSVAAILVDAGHDVTLVEKCAAKRAWAATHGLFINKQRINARVISFDDYRHHNEVVYLCVKCYDNAEALNKIPDDAILIPVQNGFDELLDSRVHDYEAIASYVAMCEPGTMNATITRPGDLHLGRRESYGAIFTNPTRRRGSESEASLTRRVGEDMHSQSTPMLAAVVSEQGPGVSASKMQIRIVSVQNIMPIKATKLMYNAAISPLAAGAGLDNGELLTDPLARSLFFGLIRENYRILTAAGLPLGKVGPFHPRTVSRILKVPGLARIMAKFFVKSLRGTYCSMAGEIEKGRTELVNYTGHLLKLAKGPAPCNEAVFEIVSNMTKPDRGVLQAIAERICKTANKETAS